MTAAKPFAHEAETAAPFAGYRADFTEYVDGDLTGQEDWLSSGSNPSNVIASGRLESNRTGDECANRQLAGLIGWNTVAAWTVSMTLVYDGGQDSTDHVYLIVGNGGTDFLELDVNFDTPSGQVTFSLFGSGSGSASVAVPELGAGPHPVLFLNWGDGTFSIRLDGTDVLGPTPLSTAGPPAAEILLSLNASGSEHYWLDEIDVGEGAA